ncbi:CDP-alcohol phosphatidyltransferase family protein [Ferruginivarius sediminum]|uniref:CDP-alcohol phosphatidyltransferase family protein n=1 Tax=Ferruginivarius sediminum TaxID=2661937 RepID=A0A369TC90_9PROT|nr:CDP-alcohol phosphatidyltransferase family protein [Ferruginivarius sediminum]RDD60526.1 CDP-alcohol phosphatidyltransferase family protein [Ferruginivarius sediminum]
MSQRAHEAGWIERTRAAGKAWLEAAARPLARILLRLNVSPNVVTLLALALSIVAAWLIVAGQPVAGALVFLAAGALDLLDGTLARLGRLDSRVGAFLDSTLDRVSEGVVFTALAAVFASNSQPVETALTMLALLASVLVSYARARAEALGAACAVGLATRGERVVLLVLGLVTGLVVEALALILVLSAITVVQRIRHTARELAARE